MKWCGGSLGAGAAMLWLAMSAAVAGVVEVRLPFTDRRNPPMLPAWPEDRRDLFELGQAVFNTAWVPAGVPRAQRRDGLGPVFNAASCDACHNNGARMRGVPVGGRAPTGFVLQLGGRDGASGDPVYGHVLNTEAIDGHRAEGEVVLHYQTLEGRYPDGQSWQLRQPRYKIRGLRLGALDERTVQRPRIAPALFGAGLIDAARPPGVAAARFGWRGDAAGLAEQTARAFSQEMGLSSHRLPVDDCGPADEACRRAPHGGVPEVSDDFLAAVIEFQSALAVPAPPRFDPEIERSGAALFDAVGCARCHWPRLAVTGISGIAAVAAYTDLRTHDLGRGLADRDGRGAAVTTRWRTAPLWGLGAALAREGGAGLLHDGRARTVEEAVLWHDGEAASARLAFERLPAGRRARLIAWIGQR